MLKFVLIVLIKLLFMPLLAQTGQFAQPKALLAEIKKLSDSKLPQLNTLNISLAGENNSFGSFYTVENSGQISFAYAGRVKCCRAGGCKAPGAGGLNDEFEFFDYFILYNQAGSVVRVKVYNYEATHGQEITLRKWLSQFIGFDASKTPMVVGKNVDSISGATISVFGITDDINNKTRLLHNYLTKNISKL